MGSAGGGGDIQSALDLLRDRSTNDPDEKVRKFAEEKLAIWQARDLPDRPLRGYW